MRSLVIDGVQIPESLIAREAQNHPGPGGAEAWAAAGHALALKALLLARARELGLEPDPDIDADGREETAEEALVRAVLESEVEARAPTEAECRRVYDSRPAQFRTPDLYEASHILAAGPDDEARAVADRALADLAAGRRTFASLAKAISDCPSAAVGGSLGQLSPGDLVPEVEAVLQALAPGEVCASPVRSRFGWHILRLDRRIEGRALPFEHVEPAIRLQLEARAWTAAATRYAADLVAEARGRGVPLRLEDDGQVAPGAVMLGDVLTAPAAADRLEAWLAVADPALLDRAVAAASADGVTLGQLVRRQAVAFVDHANDEAWTQLISAAQGASDPAVAGLTAILKDRLQPPARRFTVIQRRT